MFSSNPILHNRLIVKIVDDIARKTGLGVVFTHKDDIYKEGNSFSYKSKFSKFCDLLSKNEKIAPLCHADHKKRGLDVKNSKEVCLCHAGLYNYSIPIVIDDEAVASVLFGQRKIKSNEKESVIKFRGFIENIDISEEERKEIIAEFNKVSIVSNYELSTKAHLNVNDLIEIIRYILEEEKHNKIRMNSIVHEILLPMQALIIDSENLKDETYGKAPDITFIRDNSTKILFEVNKLHLYVENLRRILRMPVLRPKHNFALGQIYPLIEQAIRRFEHEAKKKGVVIKKPTYLSRLFPSISFIEDEMTVAINNLYSNAIKYSFASDRKSSQRTITTECFDEVISGHNYFAIRVSNFGVGILLDEIESGKIYKAGYRGRLSMDRNRTGSGVGLYLIKHIVDLHTGRISVTSEDKHSGFLTEVTIYLPSKKDR